MQLPIDEAPLCARCEKKPATEKYTCKSLTAMVCAGCFDRWAVQDALEDKLTTHIVDLERRRQYDEALDCLDTFLVENRHRDHDGWLANSVALFRTSILFDAGRYAEAEQAYLAWARVGFIDSWRRCMHAQGLADTLEALGRDGEAVPVLEDALDHAGLRDLCSAFDTLADLARLSKKLGLPVAPKWLRIAEGAAEHYGVDLPARVSLGEAILALEEMTRSMQPRHPKEDE
jgi:hypothetical protein